MRLTTDTQGRAVTAFLEALRSSLWRRPVQALLFEGLTRKDWIWIFNMSFHQTVEGHIADAIRNLPEPLLPPQDILLKWIVRLQRIEERNQRMSAVISSLGNLFRQREISVYLQKGQGVSLYYPKPELRVGGDIDWYFPSREDYIQANRLMKEKGQNFRVEAGYSSGYSYDGIEIEHHLHLIQLRNPLVIGYAKKLVEDLSRGNVQKLFGEILVDIPSPMLNIIQVNAHILKHQVSYGIGLRQLCDAAILYHSFYNVIDGVELKGIYKKLGMLHWAHTFHRVLTDLLDLDEQALPFHIRQEKGAAWMKDYILRSGNFGFYDPRHPDIQKPYGRVNRTTRLVSNFKHLFPLAPAETFCFPFVHLFSKVHH